MTGMLNLALEELDDPLYYVLDDISSVMHCESPNHNVFRSAILNAGYQVSYSHCSKNSIKTNAPTKFIWDLLKRWIETKPIKEKWLVSEYRVFHILKTPAEHQVDFTVRFVSAIFHLK
jgi:tRNA (guanine26-N2/guanine27-N2)-dimethyltransferase